MDGDVVNMMSCCAVYHAHSIPDVMHMKHGVCCFSK